MWYRRLLGRFEKFYSLHFPQLCCTSASFPFIRMHVLIAFLPLPCCLHRIVQIKMSLTRADHYKGTLF